MRPCRAVPPARRRARARAPSPFPMGTMIPCSCPVVLAWMPLPLVWQCHEHILHGGHELAGGGSTEPRAADAFPDEPRRPDRGPPAPRRWDHWQGWLRRMHGDHRSPRARQVSLRARGAAVGGLGCHRGRSVLRPRVSLLPRVGADEVVQAGAALAVIVRHDGQAIAPVLLVGDRAVSRALKVFRTPSPIRASRCSPFSGPGPFPDVQNRIDDLVEADVLRGGVGPCIGGPDGVAMEAQEQVEAIEVTCAPVRLAAADDGLELLRGYRLQGIRHDGDGAIVEDGFVGAAHGSGRDGVPVVASTFRAAKILSQLALTWTRRFAYSSSLRIGPMRPKENAMPSSEGAAQMVLAVSVMVGSSMGMPVTVAPMSMVVLLAAPALEARASCSL